MQFSAPPQAYLSPVILTLFHMVNPFGATNKVQSLLQNHTLSMGQNVPQYTPPMEQQPLFQTQPESIEHKMDLGANSGDQ
eukprot:5886941-Ditylum_brightwellii.AAC.1